MEHRDAHDHVYGIHPVQELLDRRVGEVERLYVAREGGGGLKRILGCARRAGVPITHLPRNLLSRKLGARAVHQGVAAVVSPIPYVGIDALCREVGERPDGLLVLVDRVNDAGNLGSILRSAAAAGAGGVILCTDDTVGLTSAVAKTSAGAVERIPVAREPKPAKRILALREAGFEAMALDPRGRVGWDEVDLSGRTLLVAGGEARGPRPGVLQACNIHVSIPLASGTESLNVAISVGVLLFEAVRQRRRSARP